MSGGKPRLANETESKLSNKQEDAKDKAQEVYAPSSNFLRFLARTTVHPLQLFT